MLTCFLCEKSGSNVKKFTEEKLEKCRRIQAFRKKKKLLCHRDVVLPKSLQQKGYHLQCYVKFIMLKSDNRKEFAMFSDGKVLNNIPPLKIDSRASTSVGLELPAIEEKTCDIDLKVSPLTYTIDEPSYVNPDISKGVILKSILTRKCPVKKDMLKDPFAFNSGMDLLRYGCVFNQEMIGSNLNVATVKLEPKIEKNSDANNVCLFCGREQRKVGTEIQLSDVTTKDVYKKVLALAKKMGDEVLMEKLDREKTLTCHPLCRVEYKNKHLKITSKNCHDEDWLVIEKLYNQVFHALCSFIDNEIIDKNKTFLLTDLFDRYRALLFEIQNTSTPLDVEMYDEQQLRDEILDHYHGNVKITPIAETKTFEVHKNGQINNFDSTSDHEILKHDTVAFELRNEIKTLKRRSDCKKSSEIPEKLHRFVSSLIQGPNGRNSFEDSLKIKTVCEDIMARVDVDD